MHTLHFCLSCRKSVLCIFKWLKLHVAYFNTSLFLLSNSTYFGSVLILSWVIFMCELCCCSLFISPVVWVEVLMWCVSHSVFSELNLSDSNMFLLIFLESLCCSLCVAIQLGKLL